VAISLVKTRTGEITEVDPSLFYEWTRASRSFEQLSAQVANLLSLEIEPVCGSGGRVNTAVVTWNHLALLSMQPLRGRTFAAEDETPGAAGVTVLSASLWRECFASRQDILGTTIHLNRRPYTVIGVVDDQAYPGAAKLWLTRPLAVSEVVKPCFGTEARSQNLSGNA